MIWLGLAFFAGTLFFQQLPAFPPIWLAAVAGVAALLLLRLARWPLAIVIGFFWAWWSAQAVLSSWLPPDLVARDLIVSGVVDDLPQQSDQRQKFVFSVESTRDPDDLDAIGNWQGRARLTWRNPPHPVKAGERRTLGVRLYRPSGFRNPGGLDYEQWLYANRLGATGYVLARGDHLPLSDSGVGYGYQQMREALRGSIDTAVPPSTARALFKALVIGDRSGFDDTHWEVFRKTGTSHLVAISGLHLGLLAGLVFWLVNRLWRLSEWLCRLVPAMLAAAVFALLGAVGYALLAGLSLPTQRALVMIAAGGAALLLRRNTSPPHILTIALVAVLACDPIAVLSAGFWLSFGAVAVIFLVFAGRLARPALLPGLVRLQFAITLGLVPAMAVWELPIAPLGLLVNLLAVPWFSVVVVPLSLLATLVVLVLPGLANEALSAVLFLLDRTWLALSWASDAIPWTWRPVSPNPGLLILSVCGILVLLVPLPWRLRLLGLAMFLPLLFPRQHGVEHGAIRLAVLDVGQGLSVVVQTANHTLVYDLGPRFPSGFSTAEAVVLPFLAVQGVPKVDRLMLSHDDVDHAGAWREFLAKIPVGELLSGQSAEMGHAARACRAGDQWYWDGVRFEVLHPPVDAIAGNDNDQSCVISIHHSRARILLTGDITRKVEAMLVRQAGEKLAADIVVIPHHGSRTSSSSGFVAATGPGLALVSAGYRNRYGFPDEEISERWRRVGAQLIDTAESGAIIIDIPAQGDPLVSRFRESARRYWHR